MARDRVTSKNKAIRTQIEETAGRSLPPLKLEDRLTVLREKPKGRQAGDLGSSGEGAMEKRRSHAFRARVQESRHVQ